MAVLLENPLLFGNFSLIIATDLPLSILSTINAACRLRNKPFYAAATFGMYGFIFADLIYHEFIIEREKSNIPTKIGRETPTRTIKSTSSSRSSDGRVTEIVTKSEIYTPILLANTSPLPEFFYASRRRRFNVTPLLSCMRALWDFQAMTKLPFPTTNSRSDLEIFTTLATNKHKELQLPAETLRSDLLRSFLQNLGCELSPVCAFLGGQLAQDAINVIGKKEQPIQNMIIFDGDEMKGPVYPLHSDLTLGTNGVVPGEVPVADLGSTGEMPMADSGSITSDSTAPGAASILQPSNDQAAMDVTT